MRVLAACEQSQVVTEAFRTLGAEAYSCDIMPCSGGHHEWHILGDVRDVLDDAWDIIVAFPPCTHLCVSGARHFPEKRADGRQREAADLFLDMAFASCSRVAVENPVGVMSTLWREPDQIIQPWQFGHDASKATCLWLRGLPPLKPTWTIELKRYANQTPSGQNRLGPSPERPTLRSKTYAGIAAAMAEQWTAACRRPARRAPRGPQLEMVP